MKGFLTRGKTSTLKAVTHLFQNSIRFYLERGYFESLDIYPGHEAYNKEGNIFGIYFGINTEPTMLHVLLRFRHKTWWSMAYRFRF